MFRILLIAMLGLCGCRMPCPGDTPDGIALGTPEDTLDTFVRAFACDDPRTEYACFSDPVRQSFNGYAGYKLGRAIVREENHLQVLALRWADLADKTTVTLRPGGRTAIARIQLDDDQVFVVELVNEPRYFMILADGERIEGYATHAEVHLYSDVEILLALRDPAMEIPEEPPVLLEVESRWVIRALPGLGRSLAADIDEDSRLAPVQHEETSSTVTDPPMADPGMADQR